MKTPNTLDPRTAAARNPARRGRQGGFTLIELSIVIAIGLLLILAGLKFAPALMRGTRVQGEVQNVGMLVSNVRNVYHSRYANLSNAQAIQFNLPPTDLVDGGNISGHWGPITLAPSALAGGAANTAMQVTLTNIPQPDCIQLAPALLGVADELDVGGAANLKSANNPNPANDAIAAACGAGGAVNIVVRAL